MLIIESGMTVAEDYPDIKHEIVVKRALQRKNRLKQTVAQDTGIILSGKHV